MEKYSDDQYIATVSVVVPVCQGEKTISTLVRMSASVSDWIVTFDEDGLHDPKEIAKLLDTAVAENSHLGC